MSYAIDIIKKYEGLSLKAYKCPAGVWTIGYGTTVYPDGKPVKSGDVITKDYASALLLDYVINKIMPHIRDLDLTDNQQAALCSLIYNIGWGAFSKSKCYKAIKTKDWETVYKNWDWCKANGKFLKGLAKRRAEELYLFFQDL
jgi:lysozyme